MWRLVAVLLALSLNGCLVYEYEHEFWLKVDGSGRVHVTGQPVLWQAFKGVAGGTDPQAAVTTESVRTLFEKSGLRVRRVTLTHRRGNAYVFVAADFDDLSRLPGTPAFPDLDLELRPQGEQLRLKGVWHRAGKGDIQDVPGLMAVRFHLPSKVYEHNNAVEGVERGNIVAWRQDVAAGLRGQPLTFGASMDRRSILWSTLGLFAAAIALALVMLTSVGYLVIRRGRRLTSSSPPSRS